MRAGGLEQWVERRLRFILLAPAVIVLLGLTVFPTVYMVVVSLQRFNPADAAANEFVGLANFARLLADDKLHNAALNTLVFTVAAVTIELLLGLGFALLVDRHLRRLTLVRTVLLIPMMLPPVAVAITWKLLFQPQFGALNDILGRLGFGPFLWTAGIDSAMPSIILVDVWEWTPFVFLMCLAGLSGLPDEPYEAAELDGANAWQKFRDLTLPLLRPVLTITILLRTMDALRLFDQVYILPRGGPAGATETLSYYIYKVAFRFFDIGYSAAISLVMLAATIAFSSFFIRRIRIAE